MKRFVFFLSALIVLSTIDSFSQLLKEFSGEIDQYTGEIDQLISRNLSDDNQDFLDEFLLRYDSNTVFSEDEKQAMIDISQQMLEGKARPLPHFLNYLKVVDLFKEKTRFGNLSEMDYYRWQIALKDYLKGGFKLGELNDFYEFTIEFLQNNTINKSYSTKWVAASDDYKFVYEQNKLRILFNQTDLICYAKRDSIRINQTSGYVLPFQNVWVGRTGTVDWTRAGYDAEEVRATLGNYRINLAKSEYEADSVTYLNRSFIDKPLLGHLHDKVMNIANKANVSYPQFQSYNNDFTIKNLYRDVDYDGGLFFSGAKIIGKGNQEGMARLKFLRADTLLLEARSDYFVIKEEAIRGLNTEVTIYLKSDSIYHPDLDFRYLSDRRELFLKQTDEITSRADYFNSYHKVNMNFEQLYWMIDEPFIYLTMIKGSSRGEANFQSVNFFNKKQYEAMRGLDRVHPLVAVWKMQKKVKRDHFTVKEFAKFMKQSISSVKHYLMNMAADGFIYYNTQTGEVEVRDRLNDYLNAYMGKIDYDVIDFKSETHAPLENAYLDIRTMDLTVNGMPQVEVSNAQKVNIFPEEERIILKRNRNFQFDGVVQAGLFTFYGDNFTFNYDTFKINLQSVDSVTIMVKMGEDNYGDDIVKKVRSKIEGVTGELLIDAPFNKSGKADLPKYPVFKSKEPSYVYYDSKKILNGKYPRNSFYFRVDPYTIDSLDDFSTANMKFEGQFVSSGIFPKIPQQLSLQEDRSLGFTEEAPEKGYSLYQGKGRFYNTFNMSNKGLRGDGRVDYITSSTYSDDFVFYPDSMNTDAQRYLVSKKKGGQQYPDVKSENIYVHWLPKQDEMNIWNKDKPFDLFAAKNTLDGNLKLEPTGLSGAGVLDMKTAVMRSELYQYKADEIFSDTASFKLRSLASSDFTMKTQNVNAHINYRKEKGDFVSNDDFTLVDFPENKYISYLDQFTWLMREKKVEMRTSKDYTSERISNFKGDTLSGPRYISVHHSQDSLNFVSPEASYDYQNNVIKAEKVKYIMVADAVVYPNEEKVYVEANAMMRTLYEAEIMANNASAYHRFYEAKVNINSRHDYKGNGTRDYIDERGRKQPIHFNKLYVQDTLTRAQGVVPLSDSFMLSPYFQYQGDVYVKAEREFMRFKGGTKITTDCSRQGKKWLFFETVINPDSIYIPISDDPVDINRQNLYAGLLMSHDSIHVYPSFIGGHKNYSDSYIATSSGYLHYNHQKLKYEIAPLYKMEDNEKPGNYISLFQNPCTLYGEGRLDLGLDYWQVNMETYGKVTNLLDSQSVDMNLLMVLDFFIDKDVQNMMATHLDSLVDYYQPTDISYEYEKNLNELVYNDSLEDIQVQDLLWDTIEKWPRELEHTMMVSHLDMEWSQEHESYRHEGKMGIASIGRTPMNLEVNAYMELRRKRSGDRFDLYFWLDQHTWYYFGYNRGVMQVLSSNQHFVDAIKDIRNRKRKLKVDRGEKPYIYMPSTADKMQRFLGRFQE